MDPTEDPVLSMEVVLKNISELLLQLHDKNSMGGIKSGTYSGDICEMYKGDQILR